jgi:hypothetical protein
METLKNKGVTYWIDLIRTAHYARHYKKDNPTWYTGWVDRKIKEFSKREFSEQEVRDFFEWIMTDEGQEWFARKSPSNAAKFAIRWRCRLCPSAEKFVLEKAKDRGSLLQYCITFGIVLDNMEKVTLKAAFGERASDQKRYIKHIEETKKKMKTFLAQMVNNNQVDPNKTIKEFLESV